MRTVITTSEAFPDWNAVTSEFHNIRGEACQPKACQVHRKVMHRHYIVENTHWIVLW